MRYKLPQSFTVARSPAFPFSRSEIMVRKIAAFGVVVAVLIGILLYSQLTPEPLKVSGYIEADEIRLGSRVGGRVQSVHIDEGDVVQPGQLLVELAPYDLLERRAEAEAKFKEQTAHYQQLKDGYRPEEIAEAKAQYEQLRAEWEKAKNGPRPQEIDVARAELDSAQADLDLEKKQRERVASLYAKGAATPNELDQADERLKAAQAQVNANEKKLDLLLAGTRVEDIAAAKARMDQAEAQWQLRTKGYREEDVEQAYASMRAAQYAMEALDRQVEELKIVAPSVGTVQAIELQQGDMISANAPALSMLDTSHLWVRAYVPENYLDLSLGQRLKVTVDSYPDEQFTGKVTFIARQAEFTPRNVQTPEERSKQVFRIKVHLVTGLDKLKSGMGADVWLEQ